MFPSSLHNNQAILGSVAGIDLAQKPKVKLGEVQQDDTDCDMRQMLSRYGTVITGRLASH